MTHSYRFERAALGVMFAVLLAHAAHPQGLAPSSAALSELFVPPGGKSHRVSSASLDPASNLDFVPLAAGAEIRLANLQGPGVITRFWLTLESDDPYYPRLIVLRAKWDDEDFPSIEVPVGDFFGVGNALEAEVDTLPMRVAGDGRARVCYLPMPFNESAEISLRNDSMRPARLVFWEIDWSEGGGKSGGRTLHAHFRVSSRQRDLLQHKIAEISGRGHYVGTVLSIWSGEDGWPGEGDDRWFFDGSQRPTYSGVGFESAFDEAWGFRVGTGPFGGVTVHDGTGPGARTTAVRWHVNDPIPFEKGLSITFERLGYALRNNAWALSNDRNDAYSSVAFWYQQEPHGALTVLPTQNERLPFFEVRVEPEEKDYFETITVPKDAPEPRKQMGSFWAYGAEVLYRPSKLEEGKLSIPFDVPSPREYDLYLRLTRAADAGAWEAYVDDEPIGPPMDLYAPRPLLREQLLGRRHLKPGGHVLELRCTGRNLESTGYALGFDSFMARWYP